MVDLNQLEVLIDTGWFSESVKDLLQDVFLEVTSLRAAINPSAETKAVYIGEFHFDIEVVDEDGQEVTQKVTVPWTTTKEIMKEIKLFADNAVGYSKSEDPNV